MKCSKCRTEIMIRETYEGIEVDRCPACKGLYLDIGELKGLINKNMGNTADTLGFSSTSDHMNKVRAFCFRCKKDMQAMIGPGDIRVEKCPECRSIFLDQGELASLQLYKS